jgi:hypothetical protein
MSNKVLAWMNEDGDVTTNEIQAEYWEVGGKKIFELGLFVDIDFIHESLGAIRYGVKNNQPCLHIINDLIDRIRKTLYSTEVPNENNHI